MNANPFYKYSGSENLKNPTLVGTIIIIAIVLGYALSKGGFTLAAILFAIPVLLYCFYRLILNPKIGLTFAFIINFFIIGISRYIPVKVGYLMDITLVSIYIAIFFHYFDKKISLAPVKNELTYLSIIWLLYIILGFFNPEAYSKMAWFSSMRGIGLYMALIIPLIFLIYNEPKDLQQFLRIWGVISILAALKAAQQIIIGPDPWEQRWLDSGGNLTHIIFGRFRAFSFYSDAGQFGAALSHIAVVATIILINSKKWNSRIFWTIVMVAGYYGMAVSGTRGAMFVPIGGLFLYMILNKNVKALIVGLILFTGIYVFFRYTYIGNSNYQIYRMRSAFTPEDDASYRVRIQNQKLFEDYLKNKPFGVGVGHAGSRAKTYASESFLANVATDSWFVLIWAENGIVGLYLHLFILGFIIGKGSYIVMFVLKDPEFRGKIAALLCGIFGVIVASYGNAVLGQFPTGIMVYTSMAFVFMSPEMEKKILAQRLLKQNT
ncbi:MAG: O-antigen ligase family protein [Bacteroidales bacterium]|nr:O-antigen ligase family protein [Bacteroidales bacterium]